MNNAAVPALADHKEVHEAMLACRLNATLCYLISGYPLLQKPITESPGVFAIFISLKRI